MVLHRRCNHVFFVFGHWNGAGICQNCLQVNELICWVFFCLPIYHEFYSYRSRGPNDGLKWLLYQQTIKGSEILTGKAEKGTLTGVDIGPDLAAEEKVWRMFRAMGDMTFACSYTPILIEIQVNEKKSSFCSESL